MTHTQHTPGPQRYEPYIDKIRDRVNMIPTYEGNWVKYDDLLACVEQLERAMNDLFDQCAMTHKYWGDGDNTEAANRAIQTALALVNRKEDKL